MTDGEKLDQLVREVVELRVAMAGVAAHIAQHDTLTPDIERRLRALERWRYGVPSLAAVLSVLGVGISLWRH